MQQEEWVLPLPTYIMGTVHHEMGIRSCQLIVSRCRDCLRRMFTKLEQRSWLKLKSRQGRNSRRVTEDWKRLAVWQHYRIGRLQGGFEPSAVDRSVRTVNNTKMLCVWARPKVPRMYQLKIIQYYLENIFPLIFNTFSPLGHNFLYVIIVA